MAKQKAAEKGGSYKVVHMAYGGFPKDRVVTEDDLKEAGYTLRRGLETGALVSTDEPPTATPLEPNPHTVTNDALRKMAGQDGSEGGSGETNGGGSGQAGGSATAPVPPTNAELRKMKVDELMKVAEQRQIEGREEMRKDELLEALLAEDEDEGGGDNTVDDDT